MQSLDGNDTEIRLQFAAWYLDMYNNNNNFVNRVLFSDEASFTREGIFNYHNNHIYAYENPHAVHVNRFQREFRLNVWAAVVNDTIIGPIFLPPHLNGQIYRQMIVDRLEEMVRDIGLNIDEIWFQQDGAPPHWAREVRNQLDVIFPQRWIGRGGPINMPPRSPDLTVMDYFVCGWIKDDVYKHRIDTAEQINNYVVESFNRLRGQPGWPSLN